MMLLSALPRVAGSSNELHIRPQTAKPLQLCCLAFLLQLESPFWYAHLRSEEVACAIAARTILAKVCSIRAFALIRLSSLRRVRVPALSLWRVHLASVPHAHVHAVSALSMPMHTPFPSFKSQQC